MRWTQADVEAFQKRQGRAPIAKAKRVRQPSELERLLSEQIKDAGLQAPYLEHRPIMERRWRLDFSWVNLVKPGGIVEQALLGVEVQGMVHRIKGRFKADIEKRAELMLAGWRILEVDGDSIRSGRAIAWIRRLLT